MCTMCRLFCIYSRLSGYFCMYRSFASLGLLCRHVWHALHNSFMFVGSHANSLLLATLTTCEQSRHCVVPHLTHTISRACTNFFATTIQSFRVFIIIEKAKKTANMRYRLYIYKSRNCFSCFFLCYCAVGNTNYI